MTEVNNQYDYKKQSYKKLLFIIIGLIICTVSFVTDIIVGPASLTLSDVWLALTDPAEVSKMLMLSYGRFAYRRPLWRCSWALLWVLLVLACRPF